jgi:hypothetical protein
MGEFIYLKYQQLTAYIVKIPSDVIQHYCYPFPIHIFLVYLGLVQLACCIGMRIIEVGPERYNRSELMNFNFLDTV